MASEPETLERKQRAQQSPTEPWRSATGKRTKDARTKGKGKARQDLEALDDFFEGEDSGANEDNETNEKDERDDALSVPAEVPANRRRDKSTTRLKRDFEPVEKHSKKAKRKKHRGQATAPTPIVQDGFFNEDQSE